jgi:hypothetical protein
MLFELLGMGDMVGRKKITREDHDTLANGATVAFSHRRHGFQRQHYKLRYITNGDRLGVTLRGQRDLPGWSPQWRDKRSNK